MEVNPLVSACSSLAPAADDSRPCTLPGLSSSLQLGSCRRAPPCMRALYSPERQAVLSPITNLAHGLNNLDVLGSDTPKRRPHTLNKVPSFASDTSDAGLCMDSPSPVDSTIFDELYDNVPVIKDTKVPFRRIKSLPMSLLGSSPSFKPRDHEAESFVSECPSRVESDKENLNAGFEFKKPTRPISRTRLHTIHGSDGKEAFANRPNSAPALMFSPSPEWAHPENESPISLRRSSFTCSINDEDDDGFLEILDDEIENDADVPTGMASLLTAPLVRKKEEVDNQPIIRGQPRGLFRTPSLPCSITRPALKRPERPHDENSPLKLKRRKSIAGAVVVNDDFEEQELMKCRFAQRSKSFCDADIGKLIENDTPELIGDFSKPFILPTVEGKHQDLKYITPEMMVAVLNGEFSHLVEQFVIIDCRYPYEFDGGHIKGALNLHMEVEVEDYLLKRPITPSSLDKRVLIIFHCEFSSERGPRMCRFIRTRDRMLNKYPNLHYPELYILKGGYREFFPKFQTKCEPQDYRPMHHVDFKEDLRKFRMKSRTWAGEKSKRDLYSRLKML
ncbi:M-phase inducer phosphatase 2 [Polypterus senegalus]|nr:M-phase inducer phosphatase 2 [Polypterus senegalus]